ncbi:TauD/TfdA family dioxygenase [Legionella clemsonensis]|uniref:Taurine catabolism dioxygenase TauD, TfdA family n=1 Tax=Legionella clemsonensis TaxID=1867846 RepID=A0A222P5E2_9GAMM|nr:TauD/TfdA family dioxygenase [Legionella clemsonensis]ASQ47052.1 Taurine catabolism dioxygenase TauD, TfdA family [Legionella clemsonensis]
MLCDLKEIQKYINTKEYCLHPGMNSEYYFHPEEDFLNTELLRQFVDNNGFAIVQLNNKSLRSLLKTLAFYLGPPMKDSGVYKKYIAKVQAAKNGKFYVNSNMSQPLHTDEGYTNIFPRYASLYCLQQSNQGGISTIVPVETLLNALYNKFGNQVAKLFQADALSITTKAGTSNKQILFTLDNGSIGMSYSPFVLNWRATAPISDMIIFINEFIHDPSNQHRIALQKDQLLVMDNCRIFHGRTEFNSQDNRLLLRFWNKRIAV